MLRSGSLKNPEYFLSADKYPTEGFGKLKTSKKTIDVLFGEVEKFDKKFGNKKFEKKYTESKSVPRSVGVAKSMRCYLQEYMLYYTFKQAGNGISRRHI